MSGGSMEYLYGRLEDCKDMLEDAEMIDLATDFAKVLHDCEWWHSGDCGEESYRNRVKKFKKKWLSNGKDARINCIKTYLNEQIEVMHEQIEEILK